MNTRAPLFRCSPHWRITKRDLAPKMEPVSYGLWQRCEYRDTPITKQGVSLGTRPHVLACWPNVYLRYSPETFNECYNIRRNCPVMPKDKIPKGCACRYLPSDRALQWLTILAAVFLTVGLLLLYLKTIAQPQNGSFASNTAPSSLSSTVRCRQCSAAAQLCTVHLLPTGFALDGHQFDSDRRV